jgi:enoyl-CoA hydratase/carnithine racemase
MGVGFGLADASDLRIASPSARLRVVGSTSQPCFPLTV